MISSIKSLSRNCIYVLVIGALGYAHADVKMTNAFSNHAVLQRNMNVPVWGKASPGEEVTVSIGEQSKTVTTASNGTWRVLLDPMEAAGPLTMTIKGSNTVSVTDVYIGEVWQIAGQSNMDTRLSFYSNLTDSIKSANVPLLRYFTLRQPGQSTGGKNPWIVVSSSTAGNLSAMGYFFGKEILKVTDVAVGLVVTAVGGTTVTQWMDPATLRENSTRRGCPLHRLPPKVPIYKSRPQLQTCRPLSRLSMRHPEKLRRGLFTSMHSADGLPSTDQGVPR